MKSSPESLVLALTGIRGRVLTVYLNTDQAEAGNLNRAFETQLESELKGIGRKLQEEAEQQEFSAACSLAKEFIARHKPAGRALVVFADSTRLLLSRDLNVDLPGEVHWGRPHIKPFLEALDEFERHIIVVTNKWRAKILSVFLGTVESVVDVEDDPDTKHVQTTGTDYLESQSRFQRRADEKTKKHLKHVAQELGTVVNSHPADRIILGGNASAVAELFRLLPKPLKGMVVGNVSLSMDDTVEHIVEKALQVELNAERDFELKGVERLQVAAGKQNKAITGIHETLKALQEGRIFSLYYADGLALAGKECAGCTALFADDAGETCTNCGKSLETIPDLLDAILLKALSSGSRVEQVRGEGAEKLRETGSIGAFLRY